MSRLSQARERNARIEAEYHELKKHADEIGEKLGDTEHELTLAKGLLESLGFELVVTATDFYGDETKEWRLAEKAKAKADQRTNDMLDAATEKATVETRAETLQVVIDALELRDYGFVGPNEHLHLVCVAGRIVNGTERLWSDLQATITERKRVLEAEHARRTAERVRDIAHPGFEEKLTTLMRRGVEADYVTISAPQAEQLVKDSEPAE